MARNDRKVFTYTALIATPLPLGTRINQTSWLAYPDHHILFDRVASVRVNSPDLSNSSKSVSPSQDVEAGDMMTYTLILRNDGLGDAPAVMTTDSLPHMLELAAVGTPSQGNVETSDNSLTWTTSLSTGAIATLTYQAVISYRSGQVIANRAYVSDGFGESVVLTARANFKIGSIYLPLIMKN